MALATHLGPWLIGTVKNPSNTSPTLSTSGIGTYRNTGATVAMQTSPGGITSNTTANTVLTTPGNLIQSVGGTSGTTLTLLNTTAAAEGITAGLTVVGPGIAPGTTVSTISGSAITLSAAVTTTATSPAPFLFYSNATTNLDPLTIPAGALITDIFVDVLSAFTAATGTIVISIANTTASYPVATLSYTTALAVGRYVVGASNYSTVTFATTAIGSMIMTNISSGQNSPTDAIVQGQVTGSPSGGLASVTVVYSVNNADGTYFPQTPGSAVVANY
jgi:hypothetical protein